MKIGFIGQGFVGKNIANDFHDRGYDVVRYSLEPEYVGNKDSVKSCDIVFIAVPTPTTSDGFDYSIIEKSLVLVGDGKTVVVKSTLLPGTIKKLQSAYPNLVILFSPEFLCEATAAHDAAHPMFTIIGRNPDIPSHQSAAEAVLSALPKTEQSFIIPTECAELFKYIHNIHGYMRVIFSNMFYDTAESIGVEWKCLEEIMNIDPMMSPYYNSPIHKTGRGAGGHCFIKDMAAFRMFYEQVCKGDTKGLEVLKLMESKNIELLRSTHKDLDLLRGVYGPERD